MNSLPKSSLLLSLFIAAYLSCSSLFGEDVLLLRVGKVVTGKIEKEDDETVLIQTKHGRMTYRKDEIDTVIYYEEFKKEFEEGFRKAQNNADKLYDLGLWCKKQYQEKEAKECFEAAIKVNPNHTGARSELGYRNLGGNWVTQEEYDRLLKESPDKPSPEKKEPPVEKPPAEEPDKPPSEKKEPTHQTDESSAFWAKQMVPEDLKERQKWMFERQRQKGFKTFHISNRFIIFSNLSEELTRQHATFLDQAYNELCRIFAYKGKQKVPFVLDFYANEDEYSAKEGGGGYGLYDGTRISTYFGITGTQNGTGGIMLRETTHYFEDMVWGDYKRVAQKAQWVVDGLATYMQESRFNLSTGELKVGIVNADRLEEVKRVIRIGRMPTIEQVVGGAGGELEWWTVCYFLLHYNQEVYRQFTVFLSALKNKDCNAPDEFAKAFSKFDMNALNENLKAYFIKLR
ncbi:MAG: DUF1570 domain-containing protein [Planctomycetota bacterium]|nr:DUF1570 domain-containing protein [Planctomycetota bacterium]